MGSQAVQSVFENRHILILNAPLERLDFSLDSLYRLGSLTKVREMQGMSFILFSLPAKDVFPDIGLRTIDGPNKCLKGGSLIDFYNEAIKPGGRILNVMDIPMGFVNMPNIPQFG